MSTRRYTGYVKLLLYFLVIVLLNLAGRTLFFRVDLTANKSFTLSPVSRQVVSTLTEPLTIKVFFTQNLPAPHNGTELYLHDLLKEYALYANEHFNYRFYDVSPETEGISDDAGENRQMAREYGINPVQIQMVENDELKLKQAYMGLVIIHGDLVERIPTITTTDGLEYRLTTTMQKLNKKVSALLKVKDPIDIKLVLSSSLNTIAPYMRINEIHDYPEKIRKIVEDLNRKMYGKLVFSTVDPTADPAAAQKLAGYNLLKLKWPDIPKAGVNAGDGLIGMLVQYQNDTREIPLLHEIRVPIFGTQYQLAEEQEIEEAVNASLERLVGINEELGYLTGFGTLGYQNLGAMAPQSGETLNQFNSLVSQTYSLKPIDVEKTPVPDGLKCLFIARPTEKLSDYALYQIDQALMRGTNLAIFVDIFKESQQAQQPFMMPQMPMYAPFDSGLEKLLEHYGVRIKKSIVLDENCYRRRKPMNQGGGEQLLYFVPIIKNENIDKSLDFMRDIKGLVGVKMSPLELDSDQIKAQGLTAHKLFSSSEKSWEMRDRIILHPMAMQPPGSNADMESQPLAYLLEGSFSSYFKGKPMPEKPLEQDKDEAKEDKPEASSPIDKAAISSAGNFREKSADKAKILVVASSDMLKDNLLDDEGQSANSVFLLNSIDALNGREATAAMRGKTQSYNPLEETGTLTRAMVKLVNIAGLPVLVVIFGLIVWMWRHSRRKRIQQMFQ